MPNLDDNRFLDYVPHEVRQQHRESFQDAHYLPNFLCKKQEMSLFHQLQKELTFQPAWLASSGLPFSRHLCVVSEDVLQQAPTLHAILEHLAEVFNLQPVRCLLNLYRHGGDFCNLHADQYQGDENFSVGICFGEERQLLFEENGEKKAQWTLPQRNGDVFAYGKALNGAWKHGVPPTLEVEEPSLVVMLWGQRGVSQVELPISLTGSFPILFEDPDAMSSEPRQCEVCNRMAERSGGRRDLDGHWSCRKCALRGELLGWRPCAAARAAEVTDAVTVRTGQTALAILVGQSTYLWRRAVFPDGWYALHVARPGLAENETLPDTATALKLRTPPAEKELPHQAVVGLLCLQRERLQPAQQNGHWKGPLQKYRITKTMPLKDPCPTRSPGLPDWPWHLGVLPRKKVLELAHDMRVLENVHQEPEPETRKTWETPWSNWSWWNGWDDWSGGWKSWHWNDSWNDSWNDWEDSKFHGKAQGSSSGDHEGRWGPASEWSEWSEDRAAS